ncbi:MAG: hypothetical protein AAGG48_22745 [Planctomycetota bacterium]
MLFFFVALLVDFFLGVVFWFVRFFTPRVLAAFCFVGFFVVFLEDVFRLAAVFFAVRFPGDFFLVAFFRVDFFLVDVFSVDVFATDFRLTGFFFDEALRFDFFIARLGDD